MQVFPSFDFSPVLILFCVFAFMAFIQLVYTFFIHARFAFFKEKKLLQEDELPPISVIIAARNEADNIYENLPFILDQNYPVFEVIVINHQSVDETSHLLNAYQRQFPNLHVIELSKNPHLRPGKKLPITLGVKGAKYDHLVLTDADCKPSSRNWLKSVASRYTAGTELVLGYGPYVRKKGFLNKVIRFDTAWIAVNYFSMALAKLPYMGVGRNLSYTRFLFNEVHGFKSHYSLPSGDDDLFIQEAAKKRNFRINIDEESYCYSEPAEKWNSWIRQKTRHYSTSDKYQVIKKSLLGIYPLTLLFTLISFVILMFNSEYRLITLSVFGLLLIIKWWIQAKCLIRLGEKKFVPFVPLWDVFYTVLIPTLYYSGEKKRPNRW
jgi:cellulose synthase/poly-beta-1,6-N-acetylglucosamine synthase-like glycosyltransferase